MESSAENSHNSSSNHHSHIAMSQTFSSSHVAGIETSHQQQRYFNAPGNDDPFFKPEGASNRTKRLNKELDVLLTSIQFPNTSVRDTSAATSPSQELLRNLDRPAYLAREKSKRSKKKRVAEMNQALTHVGGSSKRAKKSRETTTYDDDLS